MILTVLGDLDRRPVTYTLMRLISTLGETSVVTNNRKLITLSDNKKSGGYYLDTQINYAEDVDDYDIYVESMFYKNFLYDGIVPFYSDIIFYCSSQTATKKELRKVNSYNVKNIIPIEMYSDKNVMFGADLGDRLKIFEKEKQYSVISKALCAFLADYMSKPMAISKEFIYTILTGQPLKKKGFLPFNIKLGRK